MHEDVQLDCLLGCRHGIDSLTHYVMCPHLYAMMNYFIEETSEDPLRRFGLKDANRNSLAIVGCTFSAYHALKARVRSGKIQMQENTMTNSSVREAWSVFAESFAAEAGECRIPCSAFSLPKFIQFLCTGRRHLLHLSDHAGSFVNNNSSMQVDS